MLNPRACRRFEALLWSVAVVCSAILSINTVKARAAQQASAGIGQTAPVPAAAAPSLHEVIGRLEIPELALSVPVLANFDPKSLIRGVGHIPGTAVPGGLGNLVLAGHRDTYFRPLRNVKAGMQIDIASKDGSFRYRIDSTEVVTPDQVRVLDIGDRPGMTLITCYPFDYIGAAPKRFIVHAHLLSADPS